MDCQEFEVIVSMLIQGELDRQERIKCEQHTRECVSCNGLLNEMAQLSKLARKAAAGDVTQADIALKGFENHVLEQFKKRF